jgi:hypothetical protein
VNEKITKVLYWIAGAIYAAIVAFQSEGLWVVLNLVLIALTAPFGFYTLVTLIIMARDPVVMEEIGTGNKSKVFLGSLMITAVLYVLPIPVGITWPALVAPFVGLTGFLIVTLPSKRANKKLTEQQVKKDREAKA